jgi:2-haloacid dehalogenase
MIRACVFDAYGTLFDVAGAARAAAAEPGGAALAATWPRLAADWRQKQVEYSWHRTLTGHHTGFDRVTADALDWAMAAAGLEDGPLRARLLSLYDRLPAYPEVPGVLAALATRGLRLAILSNGTPAMLAAATAAAGIAGAFEAVLSVEEIGRFKPAPAVYALAETRLGLRRDEILFLSSNGWDIVGAAAFGLACVWVNRNAAPAERLPHGPAAILADLTALPDLSLLAGPVA